MNSPDSWNNGQADQNGHGPPPDQRRLPPLPRDPASEMHMVDRVAVRKLGGFNFLSPEQWNAMSARARKKAIDDQTATFMCDGEPVPLRSALLYLKWLADQLTAERRVGGETVTERQSPPSQRIVPQQAPAYPPPTRPNPPAPRPQAQPPVPPAER